MSFFNEIQQHCSTKVGVTEEFPFDEKTLVFKVAGKIFTLIDSELQDSINLKCDPERAIELREEFIGITPGYHMNKKHWNTVLLDGSIDLTLVLELIDHSYTLVFQSLPKKTQHELTH